MNREELLENKVLIEKIYKKHSKKIKTNGEQFFKDLKKELDKCLYKFSYEYGHNPTKENLLIKKVYEHLINLCLNNIEEKKVKFMSC